jgi:hypothetical protein
VPFHFSIKALFLNFVATIKEMQRLYTDILKRKNNFLRKDAPKRTNFEQLTYGEKQQSIRKQPQ